MKPEEKMQKVVEAAGECWHKYRTTQWCGKDDVTTCLWCVKCGLYENDSPNPSPTDLKELFRLAEKLHTLKDIQMNYDHGCVEGGIICYVKYPARRIIGRGATPEEALLNALYEAIRHHDKGRQ